jgi:sulfate transport system permease protein
MNRISLKLDSNSLLPIVLTICAVLVLIVLLALPLGSVFYYAFEKGIETYFQALKHPETLSALRLTLLAAFFSVVFNLVFGLAIAWLVTKFNFKGRSLLITLIDLPLTVSPVIAGMFAVLLYGSSGLLKPIIDYLGIKVLFAPLGIVIVTTFITVPFIARELIPALQARGNAEEEAALTMGASGLTTFFTVTLPNIKWALFYGVLLCNARAMGEFGAVSVVSGHIRGLTNTLPLQVEILYNEYSFTASFAVASLLALLAIITILIKNIIEFRAHIRKRA